VEYQIISTDIFPQTLPIKFNIYFPHTDMNTHTGMISTV